MKLKSRVLFSLFFGALITTVAFTSGCAQPDNPEPTAAPKPAAAKPEELVLPKIQGKTVDPAANPRYKKMQEQMSKNSGS